jgi:uncharacterized membrane protein YeaQ/YmgE (transglycosylase-associated protein family)
MGILTWVLIGLIAGVIAKMVMPGKDPGGIIVTIVIGIVGALIGGYIGAALGWGSVTGFNLGSVLLAIGGAILLLILYRVINRLRPRGCQPSLAQLAAANSARFTRGYISLCPSRG